MKIKVYTIWSEDQGSWHQSFLTSNKETAQKTLEDYVKSLVDCEYWIRDGLISIEEFYVDVDFGANFTLDKNETPIKSINITYYT